MITTARTSGLDSAMLSVSTPAAYTWGDKALRVAGPDSDRTRVSPWRSVSNSVLMGVFKRQGVATVIGVITPQIQVYASAHLGGLP